MLVVIMNNSCCIELIRKLYSLEISTGELEAFHSSGGFLAFSSKGALVFDFLTNDH